MMRITARKVCCILLVVTAIMLFGSFVHAETSPGNITIEASSKPQTVSPWFGPPGRQEYLTGDWGGMREELADKGVTVTSTYVCDILGNPTGGRAQGIRYDHSMGMDVNVDLEKAADIEGLQFHVSGIYRAGHNLSADKIGNAFTVTSIFGSEQLRFYGLYFDKALLDGRLHIRFGRISTGDDFAASPIYWIYVNNAIDGNPISIPLNLPFFTYPTAVWGVRTKLDVTDTFYSMTGVYNGDPDVGRDEYHGLDFSMRLSKGVLYAQEFGYTPNNEPDAEGLPGHYKIGGYYHSGVFWDLLDDANENSYILTGLSPKKHVGNYGCYAHADQMVYREGSPGSDQGLTAFAAATFAPPHLNQFPFFVMGGIFYKGLIPGRDDDIIAVGSAYGLWSRDLNRAENDTRTVMGASAPTPQDYEIMVDFTYKAQITPWFFVQPDFQYIINPGGTDDYPNAVVAGVRLGVTF